MGEGGPAYFQPDGTDSLLWALYINPGLNVRCSVAGGDPAVAIYKTPNGCAARPLDKFQALCLQHIETDGISEGSRPILDLTVGEAWSQEIGLRLPLHLGFNTLQLQEFLKTIEDPAN